MPDTNRNRSPERIDVAVIGGGPAGSAVSALLAKQGFEVELYEKAAFPRFHIGESLIPAANLMLERLGVLDRMDAAGFVRKHAVQFITPNGPSRPFYFAEAHDPKMRSTWQILRSEFDAMLLDNAVRCGAAVHTGFTVVDVAVPTAGTPSVRLQTADGSEQTVAAQVVVDASGQRGLLARTLGQRQHVEGLENVGIFAHYRDVIRDPGLDAGSTLVYRIADHAWLWMIPLAEVVSIGLVTAAQQVADDPRPREAILQEAIARCPPLAARLVRAQRTNEVRVERDFSYQARVDGGRGWCLVGDSLGFIDPMYSTGLFLSMLSAELAAQTIGDALRGKGRGFDFKGFAAPWRGAFDKFLTLVRAFYGRFRFGELARVPEHRQGLVDLLTGDVTTPYAARVVAAIDALDTSTPKEKGR